MIAKAWQDIKQLQNYSCVYKENISDSPNVVWYITRKLCITSIYNVKTVGAYIWKFIDTRLFKRNQ